MIPDLARINILEKIQEKISSINNINEYYFDYSGKVFINKQTIFTNLGINIRANENSLSSNNESSSTLWNCNFIVEIDIVCTNAIELSNLFKYEADILKCIGTNLSWDGLAINTEYQTSIYYNIDQLGNKIGDVTIRLLIFYRQNAWGL